MKKLLSALTLICILIPGISVAAEYQEEIDKFFGLFKEKKVEESIESIYSSNPYVGSLKDQLENLRSQLSSLTRLAGEIDSIEKLDEYMVGELFIHSTYLVVYERMPVRVEFQFFKLKKGWRILSFNFDDKFTNEVMLSARKKALQCSKAKK